MERRLPSGPWHLGVPPQGAPCRFSPHLLKSSYQGILQHRLLPSSYPGSQWHRHTSTNHSPSGLQCMRGAPEGPGLMCGAGQAGPCPPGQPPGPGRVLGNWARPCTVSRAALVEDPDGHQGHAGTRVVEGKVEPRRVRRPKEQRSTFIFTALDARSRTGEALVGSHRGYLGRRQGMREQGKVVLHSPP